MIDEEFFRFAGCQVKKKTYICSMIPPRIEQSTKEERRAFVKPGNVCTIVNRVVNAVSSKERTQKPCMLTTLKVSEPIRMLRWTSETIITEDENQIF